MSAQVIRGAVVEADSTSPAAFVTLLVRDSMGSVVARAQSTSTGTFALNVRSLGRYQLRALRIGFTPTDTTLSLTKHDQIVTIRIVLSLKRVVLSAVTVRARQGCSAISEGAELIALWDYASSALFATTADSVSGSLAIETTTYSRTSEVWPDSGTRIDMDPPTWRRGDSFRSRPAQELLDSGFVRTRAEGKEFYGPDARTLLDEAFVESHCYWAEPTLPGYPGLRGLGFRHASPKQGQVSIVGTLWLDSVGKLVRLEYTYRGLDEVTQKASPGGTIRFLELPTHQWVISSWRLRMPETAFERRVTGVSARIDNVLRLRRVVERGGFITRARWGASAPIALLAGPAAVKVSAPLTTSRQLATEGLQVESPASRWLLDSTFTLRAARVQPGTVSFVTRSLFPGALGLAPDTSVIFLIPSDDDTLRSELRVKTRREIAASLCGSVRGALAVGSMSGDSSSAALFISRPAAGPAERVGHRALRLPGAHAQWYACGLPRRVVLELWSRRGDTRSVHARFRIAEGLDVAFVGGGIGRAEPRLAFQDSIAHGFASLTLVVQSARDSSSLTAARVALGDSVMIRGNQLGEYKIAGLRPGSQTVVVRMLGYSPLEVTLTAEPGGVVDTVFLDPIPVRLQDIVVEGRRVDVAPRFADVVRRAASNGGRLFTRKDLAGAPDLQSVLAQIPGVQPSDRGIAFQRCQGGMPSPGVRGSLARVQVYIDGVRVTALDADSLGLVRALRLVQPSGIEYVEVYRGVAAIPAEFLNDACAVIAIWTRAY